MSRIYSSRSRGAAGMTSHNMANFSWRAIWHYYLVESRSRQYFLTDHMQLPSLALRNCVIQSQQSLT